MNSVSAEEGLFSYLSFPCLPIPSGPLGRSFPLNGFNCFLSRRRRRWRLILRVLRHFPFPPIKPLAERQSKRKVSPLQDVSLKSKRSADTLSSMETYNQRSHSERFCDVALTVKFYCDCDVAKSLRMGPHVTVIEETVI